MYFGNRIADPDINTWPKLIEITSALFSIAHLIPVKIELDH